MARPTLPPDLLDVLADVRDPKDLGALFDDLLTPAEVANVSERWELVKLLAEGKSQRAVASAVGAGVATVTRGARILKYGAGGFAKAFDRLAKLGHRDPRV
jgi:TrpR family trp operon transcriptional repressor